MVTKMTYAIIDSTGLVINIIEWDGKPPWHPPDGCTAVKFAGGAAIGWTYAKGEFTPPPEPSKSDIAPIEAPPELSPAEKLAAVGLTVDDLRALLS